MKRMLNERFVECNLQTIDAEMKNLSTEIMEQNEVVATLTESSEKSQEAIKKLENDVQVSAAQISTLQSTLAAEKEASNSLKEEVQVLSNKLQEAEGELIKIKEVGVDENGRVVFKHSESEKGRESLDSRRNTLESESPAARSLSRKTTPQSVKLPKAAKRKESTEFSQSAKRKKQPHYFICFSGITDQSTRKLLMEEIASLPNATYLESKDGSDERISLLSV